jgi:hypothetical protein
MIPGEAKLPTRTVTASLPSEHFFEVAKHTLDAPGISANKLINAALRLYRGEEFNQVKQSIRPESNLTGTRKNAQVPNEILDGIDNVSFAVRVGLGMAMLMTREQAEEWASAFTYSHGGKREGAGRPRKIQNNTTQA